MTRKQKIVVVLSVILFLALMGCTAASCIIYREMLPEVETVPLEERELWIVLEATGTIGTAAGGGRRVFCALTADEAAQIPEGCRVRLSAGGEEGKISSLNRITGTVAEITLPYTLRDLSDGTAVSVTFLLEGGMYKYTVPAGAVQGADGDPCLLTVEEVDGLTGPELRVSQFPVAGVLFSNGEYTAVEFYGLAQPPKEVVAWSSQPIAGGDAAKFAEDGFSVS